MSRIRLQGFKATVGFLPDLCWKPFVKFPERRTGEMLPSSFVLAALGATTPPSANLWSLPSRTSRSICRSHASTPYLPNQFRRLASSSGLSFWISRSNFSALRMIQNLHYKYIIFFILIHIGLTLFSIFILRTVSPYRR